MDKFLRIFFIYSHVVKKIECANEPNPKRQTVEEKMFPLDGIWPCGGLQVPLRGNAGTIAHYRNLTWPKNYHVRILIFFSTIFAFQNFKIYLIINLKIKILTSGTSREQA